MRLPLHNLCELEKLILLLTTIGGFFNGTDQTLISRDYIRYESLLSVVDFTKALLAASSDIGTWPYSIISI